MTVPTDHAAAQQNAAYGTTCGAAYGGLATTGSALLQRLSALKNNPNLNASIAKNGGFVDAAWFASVLSGDSRGAHAALDQPGIDSLFTAIVAATGVGGLPSDIVARAQTPDFIVAFLAAAFTAAGISYSTTCPNW